MEGSSVTAFPVSRMLDRAKPVLESLPGWKIDISGIRSFKALPKDARDYVLFIEKRIGVPIRWISVGPRREQIIVR
jgi:adenylosuccinate synthase